MRIYLDNCCYNRPFDLQTDRSLGLMRIANPVDFVVEGLP